MGKVKHIMPLAPASSAFTEPSEQGDSPTVIPVLHVVLAAIHFCLGKVKPKVSQDPS